MEQTQETRGPGTEGGGSCFLLAVPKSLNLPLSSPCECPDQTLARESRTPHIFLFCRTVTTLEAEISCICAWWRLHLKQGEKGREYRPVPEHGWLREGLRGPLDQIHCDHFLTFSSYQPRGRPRRTQGNIYSVFTPCPTLQHFTPGV